jgi:serine/threonine protein phosphatase 1
MRGRHFAIGDIHGCNRTLCALLQQLRLQPGDTLVCLGDYIDRGPDSKGVIDTLLELHRQNIILVTLRGNHEAMLLAAKNDAAEYGMWLRNGGDIALESFGLRNLENMAPEYIDFFQSTQLYFEWEQYVFVHAGLNFHLPDPFTDRHAMLWSRDRHIEPQKIGNRQLVHGHTPTALKKIRAMLTAPAINLDGGCVYGAEMGLGHLLALDLQTKELLVQANAEQ